MSERYAVMGNPIAHSLSPVIHAKFAEQTGRSLVYEKILIELTCFEQQVRDFFYEGGKGLNITLPCKQRAFAMSDHCTARCSQARAANTLWMSNDKLQADNTDGVGLIRDLHHYINISNQSILMLGAGGAARGVLGSLLDAGCQTLTVVNRTFNNALLLQEDFPQIACCRLDDLSSHVEKTAYNIVINATSTGLTDNEFHLPKALLAAKPFCYDLAYRARELPPFVVEARQQGCEATDGLGMLVEQAAEAFFIWHGVKPEVAPVLDFLRKINYS